MAAHLKVISVRIDDGPGDMFPAARAAAVKAVSGHEGGAMLVSWKNSLTGESFPDVGSCSCDMEGWELYAISRGATVRVEINGGRIIFMFMPIDEEALTF